MAKSKKKKRRTARRRVNAAEDAFAINRSHKASEIAYDLCKNIAQTCLLINGGAATAILAYLAKEKIDPSLYKAITLSLGLYGIGAVSSALVFFCVMMNADYWNYFWYYTAYEINRAKAKEANQVADLWYVGFYISFVLSIIVFLVAGFILAHAFLNVSVPSPINPGI
jgi:hypothetical protein